MEVTVNLSMPALFVADSPGLDFLNSVATPVDTPLDWIDDGNGLLDWLGQAKLAPREVLERFRNEAMPGELDRVAAQARDLREWFRGFVKAHKGRSLPSKALADLAPLNRLLERDELYEAVVPATESAHGLALQTVRRWKSPESLLLPIGGTLARLLTDEDFTFVKACEGPSCTLLFADHTRARNRRWCSMELCGNRAKQAAHRQRARARR
jgi:predicted RNA-binding Zn ribbon-like protein